MTPANYLELILGLLGFADRIRDHVAACEAEGQHAVLSDPRRFLAALHGELERAAARVAVLMESAPGAPPESGRGGHRGN